MRCDRLFSLRTCCALGQGRKSRQGKRGSATHTAARHIFPAPKARNAFKRSGRSPADFLLFFERLPFQTVEILPELAPGAPKLI
jgi:hypothetical protein